jgi:hypothetical protein
VWRYPRAAGWHFADLSARQLPEIRVYFGDETRGFGSLPVSVRIGKTEWRTFIFPNEESDCRLFAIKGRRAPAGADQGR